MFSLLRQGRTRSCRGKSTITRIRSHHKADLRLKSQRPTLVAGLEEPARAPNYPGFQSIRLPYAPEARLALVHFEDVARMLLILLDSFSQCSACEPQHGCGSLDCRRLRSRISNQTG